MPSRDDSPLLAPAAPAFLSQSFRRAAGGYAKLDTRVPSDGSDDPEHEVSTNRKAMRIKVLIVPAEIKFAEAPRLLKFLTCLLVFVRVAPLRSRQTKLASFRKNAGRFRTASALTASEAGHPVRRNLVDEIGRGNRSSLPFI